MNLPKILSFKKGYFFLFFFILLGFLLSPLFVRAQEDSYYDVTPNNWAESVDNPPKNEVNKERIDRHDVGSKIISVTDYILPVRQNNKSSALPYLGKMIAALYTHPPASSIYYFAYLGQNLGLVEKAYAQGLGFPGLFPILDLWKVFRNLAYMVLVVIMVVLGFMIMFRTKINPQTVISIQNALPRVVITLLLITFSYAIAGLMIDLMYLSILLVISILAQSGAINQPEMVQQHYMTGGFLNLFGAVFGGGFRALDDFVKAAVPVELGIEVLISLLGAFSASGPGGWAGAALFSAALPIIILFVLALALLFTFIRLFMILLTAYIQIILAVIFGPFQILMDALPGRNSFISWLLGLLGNLIVFPATAGLLLIASILTTHVTTQELWQPPLIGSAAAGTAVIAFIGLGMIMITPGLVSKVKAAFQPKPTFPISPMAPLMPVLGGAQTVLSTGMQFYYMQSLIKSLTGGDETKPGLLQQLFSRRGKK